MKIVVCIKQVPVRDSAFEISPSGAWIDESRLAFEINEPDAYALEEALQLKTKVGGDVIALSAGPVRVQSTLREALAKGADRAIHIQTDPQSEPSSQPDSLAVARLLAAAVSSEAPDLVLTGLQSDDLGYGQTGVILAELLGFPHATIVMEVEPVGAGLRIKRELEDGWYQHVTLPLPALLTIQSGICKLRYATLMGIKKARGKELKVIPATLPQAAAVAHLHLPTRTKQSQIFSGPAAEAAHDLVEKLRFEARVL